jgi:hypothetical protein
MGAGIRCGRNRGLLRSTVLFMCACACLSSGDAAAQSNSFGSASVVAVHPGVAAVVVAPPVGVMGARNLAGWNTGYSAVTSAYERPSRLGDGFGVNGVVQETVTRVVPNDVLGNPIPNGVGIYGERNSAGWNTGYSAVTSTYQKTGTLDNLLVGSGSITETRSRVVPNDVLGRPIVGIWP